MGGDTTKNYNYKTSEGTSSWKNGWQQSSSHNTRKGDFFKLLPREQFSS